MTENKLLSWIDSPSSEFTGELRTPQNYCSLNKYIKPVSIGNVILPNNLVLAPMAGVTDGTFRLLCSRLGAGYSISELASAKAITMQSKQTFDMLKFQAQTRPYAVQIFGSDPDLMADAAAIVESLNICDIIDINMGCPVAKVVKIGAGSALMKTPDLASRIVEKVSKSVKVPVTCKFRLGWSESNINVKEFTSAIVSSGAKAITIHARTRQAMYTGKAQWEKLEGIKEICKNITFFANGDIVSTKDIETLAKLTNCDGFMIGRGAIGKPWNFAELLGYNYFESNDIKFKIIKHQLLDMMMEHGQSAVPMFRVHLFGYLRNFPNAAKIRHDMCSERSPHKVLTALEHFFKAQKEQITNQEVL